MTFYGIYAFDSADAELTLLPMAARRALDLSGLHLSLAAWQGLPVPVRRGLVNLGAQSDVDAQAVSLQLTAAGAVTRSQAILHDPPADAPPPELAQALGATRLLDAKRWARLRPLDRFVLAQLARRGKLERLAVAYDEIVAG